MNAAPSSPHWVSGKGTSLQMINLQMKIRGDGCWGGNSPVIIMVQPPSVSHQPFQKSVMSIPAFWPRPIPPLLAWFTNICWVLFLHRGPVDREEMDTIPDFYKFKFSGTVLEATICWVSAVCQALLCLSHITTFDSNTQKMVASVHSPCFFKL